MDNISGEIVSHTSTQTTTKTGIAVQELGSTVLEHGTTVPKNN